MFLDNLTDKELDLFTQEVEKTHKLTLKNYHFSSNKEVLDILTGVINQGETFVGKYMSINFQNCHFPDLRVKETTFLIPFTCNDCHFLGLSFNRCTFTSIFNFLDCHIHGNINFSECCFNEEFCFDDSRFLANAKFANCTYNADAKFNRITITPDPNKFSSSMEIQKFVVDGGKLADMRMVFRNSNLEHIKFKNLHGINLDLKDSSFTGKFLFENVIFGPRSIFYNTDWGNVMNCVYHKHSGIISLQSVYLCLKKSLFDADAEKINGLIKNAHSQSNCAQNKGMHFDDKEHPAGPLSVFLTLEQMCQQAGIGVASYRRRISQYHRELADETMKEVIYMPKYHRKNPAQFTKDETEKFRKVLEQERETHTYVRVKKS